MRTRLPNALRRWAPAIVLAAIGVALARWTWGKWLDPVIDFGRELYVPWQLSEGKVLFRDIAWFNGPLSQYLNAALFSLFGVSLRTLVLFNLLLTAGVCCLLYRMLVAISDRFTATLGGAAFLFLFAFARGKIGNFNWICPYSHEITHGIALSIAAVAALQLWHETGRTGALAAAGLAAGLAALTKPEVFAACGLALVVGLTAARGRLTVRTSATLLSCLLLPALLALALLATAMPLGDAVRAVLGGWPHVFNADLRALRFYQEGLGVDDLALRLSNIAVWSLTWLVVLGPAVAVALLLRTPGRYRPVACAGVAAATFFLWDAIGGGKQPLDVLAWVEAFTPLPLALAFAFVLGRREKADSNGFARLVLAALAAGLLAKMLVRARIDHYGFALAVPAFAVIIAGVFCWLPRFLNARGAYGTGCRIAALGALAVVVAGHARLYAHFLGASVHPIGRGADAFQAGKRALIVDKVAQSLAQSLSHEMTCLSLPEGAMINYLARRRSPTRYINFVPPELIMFGEERILDALRARPPDVIALIGRKTIEFGLPLFGRDYGRKIWAWFTRNYIAHPDARFGPRPLVPERIADNRWSLWLYEKRNG